MMGSGVVTVCWRGVGVGRLCKTANMRSYQWGYPSVKSPRFRAYSDAVSCLCHSASGLCWFHIEDSAFCVELFHVVLSVRWSCSCSSLARKHGKLTNRQAFPFVLVVQTELQVRYCNLGKTVSFVGHITIHYQHAVTVKRPTVRNG